MYFLDEYNNPFYQHYISASLLCLSIAVFLGVLLLLIVIFLELYLTKF